MTRSTAAEETAHAKEEVSTAVDDKLEDRPSDEAILNHAQQIQEEAIDAVPLVSAKLPLSHLAQEYANGNQTFVHKIAALGNEAYYYRTRGDGNCFYRAWLFGLFSQVQAAASAHDSNTINTMKATLKSACTTLDEAGFASLVYEDFLDTTVELLGSTDLQAALNDPETSNAAVVYLRFVTSAYIKTHADSYLPYLEEGEILPRWCERWVEAIGAEADNIQINALVNALKVGVDIVYLDRSEGDEATVHQVRPDEGDVAYVVKLLYRPGHYDCLA